MTAEQREKVEAVEIQRAITSMTTIRTELEIEQYVARLRHNALIAFGSNERDEAHDLLGRAAMMTEALESDR